MRTFLGAVLLLLGGCSSTHDPAGEGHNAAHDTGAVDDGEVTSDAAADSGAADAVDTAPAGKPATPEITNVMPMAGAWHVTWKTNDIGLTKLELWRSNDGAEATLVRSLAGNARDWHDAAAPGTTAKYCWKIKTFRGTEASDFSAERCNK